MIQGLSLFLSQNNCLIALVPKKLKGISYQMDSGILIRTETTTIHTITIGILQALRHNLCDLRPDLTSLHEIGVSLPGALTD